MGAKLGHSVTAQTRQKLREANLDRRRPDVAEMNRRSEIRALRSGPNLKLRKGKMLACSECGKIRYLRPSRWNRRCSRSCAAKARWKTGFKRRPVWRDTRLELALVLLLRGAGFIIKREKRFGRYRVDAYLPERHLAFEADGKYWHSQQREHDARRDAELLERFGLPVVRLTEQELA